MAKVCHCGKRDQPPETSNQQKQKAFTGYWSRVTGYFIFS